MSFLREFIQFISVRKKYWLAPILLFLLALGALLYFSSGTAVAPFIYTVF